MLNATPVCYGISMSLFLITGNAGTGKTTTGEALKARGYISYDIDNDGFARWEHVESGFIHPKSSVKAVDRTTKFLAEHRWSVPRSDLEELRDQAIGKAVFVTGSLGNLKEVHDVFDGIVALYVDDETLTHRLTTRTTGDWGKQPHELANTLEKHHQAYEEYKQVGAVIIDSSQPLEQVVDTILTGTVDGSK